MQLLFGFQGNLIYQLNEGFIIFDNTNNIQLKYYPTIDPNSGIDLILFGEDGNEEYFNDDDIIGISQYGDYMSIWAYDANNNIFTEYSNITMTKSSRFR